MNQFLSQLEHLAIAIGRTKAVQHKKRNRFQTFPKSPLSLSAGSRSMKGHEIIKIREQDIVLEFVEQLAQDSDRKVGLAAHGLSGKEESP